VEADLQAHYGLDLRDFYHPLPGTRRLTLRRLVYLIWRNPPVDGAVMRATTGHQPWTLTDHLLDDLRRTLEAVNGVKKPKPHPLRTTKQPKKVDPKRRQRLQAARRRARARRGAIERGEIL
jgi:hypothetical protein